jgi:ABC-type glycerol-3-phosphate transport system permease component
VAINFNDSHPAAWWCGEQKSLARVSPHISVMLGVVLLIWSLLPVYNMFLIGLDPEEGEIEFAGNLWPPEPSLKSFLDVVTQKARYLEDFWRQFGNSVFIGLLTMVLIFGVVCS